MSARIDYLVESDHLLHQAYLLGEKVGSGCFGTLYRSIQRTTGRSSVLKVELKAAVGGQRETLYKEYSILRLLQPIQRVPRVYTFLQSNSLNIMEIQPLKYDLDFDLSRGKTFSNGDLCKLAIELLGILKDLHKNNVVHRDLKPQNIMFDENEKVFLIDFGISGIYNGKTTCSRKAHGSEFIGTPRYASLAAHDGEVIRFKDDLESLLYVLIYVGKRQLPWMNVHGQNKMEQIRNLKQKTSKRELTKDLPNCFMRSLVYLQNLQRDAKPDHNYLIKLFKEEREPLGEVCSLSNLAFHERDTPEDPTTAKTINPAEINQCSQDQKVSSLLRIVEPSNGVRGSFDFNSVVIMGILRNILEDASEEYEITEQENIEGEETLEHKLQALTALPPRLKTMVDSQLLQNLLCSCSMLNQSIRIRRRRWLSSSFYSLT